MKFIVKFFPEITIKSTSLRKRLVKLLYRNIRNICKTIDDSVSIKKNWDSIQIHYKGHDIAVSYKMVKKLLCVPGICYLLEVQSYPFESLSEIAEQAVKTYRNQLTNKTFAVRVKRTGTHNFTSVDAEKIIGQAIFQKCNTSGANLKEPDVCVNIEIKNTEFFIVTTRHKGLGGFPLGSQEPVLSLMSGGFDSSVASYLTIRRGIKTHFCFFNLGGHLHENGTKEIAYYLWEKYSLSHSVNFITVPFQKVIEHILKSIDPSVMGVVLKRIMLKAASIIAKEMNINTLVTGEAIAQVSSQTLPNLAVIDSATDALVIRPLIVMDKQEIISIARAIGTEYFSKKIPEYCAVISKKPNTQVKIEQIIKEEEKLDFSVIDDAIKNSKNEKIKELIDSDQLTAVKQIKTFSELTANDVVIDVRHPSEKYKNIENFNDQNKHLDIPFYSLETKFPTLDSSKRYLLYCDHGVISRLHAAHLFAEGYKNLGIYQPI